MGKLSRMIVTATELANDSEKVLNRVIRNGEVVEIQRDGKTVAEIRARAGVSREELLRILEHIRWSEAESQELKQAMDASSDVFGYAGRD